MNGQRLFLKIVVMVIIWALAWYFLHGEVYTPYLNSLFPASTTFILLIVISFSSIGTFNAVFTYLLFKKEAKADFRSFFKIERLDVKGIWLALALGIIVQTINVAFLYRLLLEPARNFLISIGLSGGTIGLGSGEIVPFLTPLEAVFLTVFLAIFWWIEVPEEMFFRGYIQNKTQDIIGRNRAAVLSAFLWDITHIFGLVNFLERFIYGLVYGFVFRFRQNTTPTMVVHPIGNRALLLAVVIPQIWSVTLQGASQLLFLFLLNVAMLILVIIGWKILRLDKNGR
jgi:membrane protease YdiL (CAAX protease family)